ncbi:penicillin-binding protein 2 [Roseospirillum parvum]|uniref:Penicillin-binding protein 2 n=1 Tax=Roseospirillum parvum TaxID=83401 RepID=A0A1G7V3U5_9PROT|nr:penicillin-binding protein 2 [Roseospirillum parvum]SDG54238.1 penicillin-binding protein 2 [Roseospirillum parvum]
MDRTSDRGRLLTRRAALLGAGQLGLFGLLVGRMYYLQVVEAERYRVLAEENRINIRLLPPPRGPIVDRNGIKLAINRQNFRVLVVREDIVDLEATLGKLARIVPLSDYDRQRVLREVGRRRSFVPVPVRENLTWEEMARIQVNAHDLPGVLIDEGQTRHYEHGPAMAHLMGYVAAVSEEDLAAARGADPLLELPGFKIGKAGVEREFDLALRGKSGSKRVEVNARGREIRELEREEGEPGGQLALTLDINLQQFAADRLGQESASCVVMDIHSGEVLAMTSTPAFDPNAFTRGLSSQEWKALLDNPRAPLTPKAIAGQYAPGSTFKMVVALAALEAGVIKPEQTVWCPGHMTLGNARFHCWKRQGHGHVSLVQALAQSCDVYFYEVAKRTGIERIADMARRFGLGSAPDIVLRGVRGGLIPTKAWKQATLGEGWHQGETLIAGIGQGYVLATPLQLALMTARLANGGRRVDPVLTRQVMVDGHLAPRPVATPESLGVSRHSLNLVRQGMHEVVHGRRGTARGAALPEELGEMCGKTGTAQVRRITRAEREAGVTRNEDLPWERRDHALFVCYAPADKPRYAVAVVVEHGGGGSAVAAPIARDVMIETLRLDSAAPRRPEGDLKA